MNLKQPKGIIFITLNNIILIEQDNKKLFKESKNTWLKSFLPLHNLLPEEEFNDFHYFIQN